MKLVISGIFLILSAAVNAAASPALILTPLIKSKKIDLARQSATVNPQYFLNVTSYSGFFTVNEKYNSNIFFWYFPVVDKAVEDTPWIVWLQGGPGASSIAGLFDEIGPFEYSGRKLKLRESTWTKSYSMLFIDNPVGAGFSFTNSDDGFITDMSMCATHLYKVLQQFLTMFPELRSAPLYLAGESYAGRYLPALGMKILDQDSVLGPLKTNTQGIIMGNPVLNRDVISDYSGIFQQWGLIDSQGVQAVKPLQEAFNKAIREHNSVSAVDLRNQLLDRLDEMAMQQQNFNVLKDEIYNQLKDFMEFLTHPEIRAALHVGNVRFTFSNGTVHEKLKADFVSEVAQDMTRLLDHYRVLIYCGQLDLTAPCVPNAQDRRRKWHWGQRDLFLKAPRTPWWYNDSVAGYVKSGGGLTEVLVRDAGHLVPVDKPEQLLKLINFFIRGLDMPYPPNYRVGVNDTPAYREPEEVTLRTVVVEIESTGTKIVMILSIFINIMLLLGILAGVVYSLRWKHRVQMFSYNNVEETSITEGVLAMS